MTRVTSESAAYGSNFPRVSDNLRQQVRLQLLHLAANEENLANTEAARVPYWTPIPSSVGAHRAAALTLRRAADDFLPSGRIAAMGTAS